MSKGSVQIHGSGTAVGSIEKGSRVALWRQVLLGMALVLLVSASNLTAYQTYTVDGRTNVIGVGQIEVNAVVVSLPNVGQNTFTLLSSDFRSDEISISQRHVCGLGFSGHGDLRAFCLNGIGDAVTINVQQAGEEVRLFFVDEDPWQDNSGTSVVEVRSCGVPPSYYTVDGATNVIGGTQLVNAVPIAVSSAGWYQFTLIASTFRESTNNPKPQPHVFVFGDRLLHDHRVFSLNGLGDTVAAQVDSPGTLYLFFVDQATAADNDGSSTVRITELPGSDCNANGVPDSQDLADCDGSMWCGDCNHNGLLDGCDVAPAPPMFGDRVDVPVIHEPNGIGVADFDDDGLLDLILGGDHSGDVTIYYGLSPSTFRDAATYTISTNSSTSQADFDIGDYDGDGLLDFATTNHRYGDSISMLYGQPGRIFGNMDTITVDEQPAFIAKADFDGDGVPDLAVTNVIPFGPAGTVSVLKGFVDGSFSVTNTLTVEQYPYGIATGDLNGDYRADLVVANAYSGSVSVLLGDGNGGFPSIQSYSVDPGPLPGNSSFVVVGDFNRDGVADVALTMQVLNKVVVLYGKMNALGCATGELDTASGRRDIPVGNAPVGIAAADLNRDGALDLVVANAGSNTVSVLLGDDQGQFSERHDYNVGNLPLQLALADFDHDGWGDIAVTCLLSDVVTILYNRAAVGRSADCDENGGPDECQADCDRDGTPDVCELANCDGSPACEDCNQNGTPDECDIAAGRSGDRNRNGIPDECENRAPSCDAGGPYEVDCEGQESTVPLLSGASDPDPGDVLSFGWTTDCPSGTFDDPTSSNPTLTFATSAACVQSCSVFLTVTDREGVFDECSAAVTARDATPPAWAGVPDDLSVECSAVPEPPQATAMDDCDPEPAIGFEETRIDGICPYEYTLTRSWTATDSCGNLGAAVQIITVVDTALPTVQCPANVVAECESPDGTALPIEMSSLDPCDSDPIETCRDAQGNPVEPGTIFPIGSTQVFCTAENGCGRVSPACSFTVEVTSTPPVITGFNGAPLLLPVGGSVTFGLAFTDPPEDVAFVTWDFGDGSSQTMPRAASPVSLTHSYLGAGIYTASATVADRCGNEVAESLVVVVYDPTAGFTTGGGWFVPDAESFIDGMNVTDSVSRANFGFVVRYRQGASNPDGNLEFQYRAGDINLKSTGMNWMVVQSASKVRFKGLARINDLPETYTFKVTAEDNGEPGTNDRFQIEIWMGVVDTENGTSLPKHKAKGVLGGGNIKIHQ